MSTAKVKAAAASTPVAAAPKAAPVAAAPKAAPVVPSPVASEAVEQAVAVGAESVETVVAASKGAVAPVAEASNDAAAKRCDQAEVLTKGRVETAVKAQVAAFQAYEEAVSSAKDAVDAVAQAGTIFSKGLQDIGKLVLGLAQVSVEEGVAASQQLLAAKTLRELVDVQSAVAKQQFDRLLSESSRLSDLSVKLVEESFAPLTERVTATVEKLAKRAA